MEKKRKKYKMTIDDTDAGVYAISLVENPAIEELWVALSKQKSLVQLAQVSDKQELIGLVLVPNKEIVRVDEETGEEYDIVFDEAVILQASELFMKNQKNNNTTIEHNKKLSGLSVVENWIVEDTVKDKTALYGMNAPVGSWAIKMKVDNDEIWQDYVKTGAVKGFSLEGLFNYSEVKLSTDTEEDLSLQQIKDLLSQWTK